MEKQIITSSLGFLHLTSAVEKRDPCLFVINGEPRRVIIHGLEAVDEHPGIYDLSVTIIDLKVPNRQHFRYSTTTYQGEWLGYFEVGHKAYEGHSFLPGHQPYIRIADDAVD